MQLKQLFLTATVKFTFESMTWMYDLKEQELKYRPVTYISAPQL